MLFGTREEMIAEGHRRIEAGPHKYLPRVWGETEFGGTSIVYVSDIDLEFLMSKPGSGDASLPELSWAALKKVPGVVAGVGALMVGTYWVIGRRMRLAALESEATPAAESTAGAPPREER
jgi:hypothetical protein